jgi:nitrite reductase (NADH) large subunit
VFKDLTQGIYKKLIFRNQLLVGVVLYGAVQDGNWYFELIQQQQPVRHLSPDLIFGQRYTEQPQSETNFDINTSEAVTGQFIPTAAVNSLAAGVSS